MAKSENQKLKLLYIRKFLLEQTDKDHRVAAHDHAGLGKPPRPHFNHER